MTADTLDMFTDAQGALVPAFKFDGATFEPEHDEARLSKQLLRVKEVMQSGGWLTLTEIAAMTGDHEQSISARLRDLRKPKFGGHTVDRRRRGEPAAGLFEYRFSA